MRVTGGRTARACVCVCVDSVLRLCYLFMMWYIPVLFAFCLSVFGFALAGGWATGRRSIKPKNFGDRGGSLGGRVGSVFLWYSS